MILFCSTTVFFYSQQKTIDSLQKLLSKATKTEDRGAILVQLSHLNLYTGNYEAVLDFAKEAIALGIKINNKKIIGKANGNIGAAYSYMGSYDSAFKYYNLAISLYKEINLKEGIAEISTSIGMAYLDTGNPGKALEYCNSALKIQEELKDQKSIANTYVYISNIYYYQSDFPKTLECLFNSLKISEATKDQSNTCACLSNIGIIYATQNDNKKALEYFKKALQLNREVNNKQAEFATLGNIGGVYVSLSKIDSGLYYYSLALKIEKEIGNRPAMGTTLKSLSEIYLMKHNSDFALQYGLEAVAILNEIGNKPEMAGALNDIAKAYLEKKDYSSTLKYAQQSLALASELNSLVDVKGSELILSNVYDKLNKPNLAFEHYKKFINARDSLYNSDNTKQITQKEMNFEFEKQQEKQRVEQEKREIEYKLAQKQKRIIILSVIGGLLLISVFSIFLYNRYRITQKQKHIIEKQKHLLEEKNQEVFDSITYAKRLQEAILPPAKLITNFFPNNFILYKPKDIVAGDFYWLETFSKQSPEGNKQSNTVDFILIAAADCTGHGVPGAMISVVCSNALNRAVKEFELSEPGKILDKVRELVLETFAKSETDVKDGMDISLASIQSDQNSSVTKIKWAGANNPLWYIEKGEMKSITANKQPIGKSDNPLPFTTHALELNKNDSFYLFTDGYADQFGGTKGKKFKYKQMQELLVAGSGKSMKEQKQILDNIIEEWKGKLEQVDDITVIGIKL